MKFDRDGDRLVIAGATRTPIGQAGKSLTEYDSFQLGDMVLAEIIKRTGVDRNKVDGLIAGEIGQSSKAPNVARVMAVKADLKLEGSAVTVANNCVSGYEAINEAARRILLGENDVVAVIGQESMTNYGYYLNNAKRVAKTASLDKLKQNWNEIPGMEEVTIVDAVVEGLTDPVRDAMMIDTAEVVAQKLGLDKATLDKYAHGSYKKAYEALEGGKYDPYLMPVKHSKGVLDKDEYIMSKKGFVEKPDRFEKAGAIFEHPEMGGMKKFYDRYGKYIGKSYSDGVQGAVSLFNACPQSDGAGGCIVTTESKAKELGLTPQAYIKGWGNFGVDPVIMGLGIAYAMRKALENTGLKWDDIGNFEIHEAFAATALGSMVVVRDEFGYDLVARLEKGDVNPHGGTLALGHPLGATGLRVLINQIMGLNASGARYSMGSICAGGGVGGSLILEKFG